MKAVLERVDRLWTRVELTLALGIVVVLAAALLGLALLKGLAAGASSAFVAGVVLRVGGLSALFAALLWRWRRSRGLSWLGALGGAGLGFWGRDVGVAWASNLLGWVQEGSTLTLLGGLRGLATRLTLALVFLGASLATAQGRHLTIDVLARTFSEGLRRFSAVGTGLVATSVCLVSAWGFFDYLAIDAFRAPPDAQPASKLGVTAEALSTRGFLLRRQLALDARVLPRVLAGHRWDTALPAEEWNAWLDAADWTGVADVGALRESGAATRVPLVVTGTTSSARGLLAKPLLLVVPLGLLLLAARFLLWVLRGAPGEGAHGGES